MFYLSPDKPGPPGVPTVAGMDNTSVALRWASPEDDGGCPVSNYNVEYRRVGSRTWTKANENIAVPDCNYTVKGLKEDAEYEFRVTADNKAGTGQPSEITEPIKIKEPVGKEIQRSRSWE